MAIKMSCDIKIKHNFKRFEQIKKELPKVVAEGVEDVLKNIQTLAIKLEKGNHPDGILVELVDTSNMEIKGRVYTDKNVMPWAMFEHYGTGLYAEMSHVGTTKHFIESGYTSWFIPVAKVEKPLSYPIIEIQGMQYYLAHGVKANHFMTDAEFQTRDKNVEITKKKIDELFRRVCK